MKMRFCLLESLCDIRHLGPLAVAAERTGFDAMAIPESIFYPEQSDSRYPYLSSGDRSFIDNPMLDPFVSATHLATLTSTLQLVTFVVKLAVRNPVLAAKSATSVAALSNNRFKFGVGLSPWPEDYAVCGEQWEKRGARMDEMLEIVRGLAAGEFFEYHGRFYDFGPIKLNPVPDRRMPVLVGGHVDAALRRAILHGDGWMHAGGDRDALDPLLARLGQMREELGHTDPAFEIHVVSPLAYSVEGVEELAAKGVTDLIVGFRNVYDPDSRDMALQQKIDLLQGYAENVISAFRGRST